LIPLETSAPTFTAESGKPRSRFSGYVRTQILEGVVAYQLQFVDGMGGPLGDVISIAAHDGSTDWLRDTAEVQAPAGAAGVQIWCQIIADGRAWFDGVEWQEKGSRGVVPVWAIGALVGAVVLGGAVVALLCRARRRD
jgi:hypothetical protein